MPRGAEGPREATRCRRTTRRHVVQKDRATLQRADKPRVATVCRKTARCLVVQRDSATLQRADKPRVATACRKTARCLVVQRERATLRGAEKPRDASSSRASYLPQGSRIKMPSEKHASGAIFGHVYMDELARYFRPACNVRYYRIRTTIVPIFVCIADTVAKLRARQLGRNRHIKPSGKYASEAILGHVYLDA